MDENFNMSDYLNLDQQEYHNSPSPSLPFADPQISPSTAIDSSSLFPHGSSQQPQHMQYNGPSHDYGQFRQQTGLPAGAISHVKAVNDFSSQIRPTTGFGPTPLQNYNTGLDLDLDAGFATPMSGGFGLTGSDDVGESSMGGASANPQSMNRAWPGMHSQQAQQAQQAKIDAEMRQQQRRRDQIMMQQPLPTNFEQTLGDAGSASKPEGNDTLAKEQISKLLHNMRHNSTASLDDDFGSGSIDLSHAGKSRKDDRDDDDMDEDERLLASEEGKKLSSKERRQLRNKVSARAFRSRRKEYITQLEGEVAAKANECNDLKMRNRQLMEQNSQLTQLTKAMLAHPAFGSFMEDMSHNPSFLDGLSNANPSSQQNNSTASRSSAGAAKSQPDNVVHVGMSMVPESNLNFSTLNLGNGPNQWTSSDHQFNFQQPQVYSVFDVPQGPSLEELSVDSEILSGKSTTNTRPLFGEEETSMPKSHEPILPSLKSDAPALSLCTQQVIAPPSPTCSTPADLAAVQNDPCFALYLDEAPSTLHRSKSSAGVVNNGSELKDCDQSEPCNDLTLRQTTSLDLDSSLRRLDQMCAALDAISVRIEAFTNR